MNPGFEGASPSPSPLFPRGHWSGGQGSAHLRNDRHRRYPSAFGIPRFVNILAESDKRGTDAERIVEEVEDRSDEIR